MIPEGVEVPEVSKAITRGEGVQGVHDPHIWALTSGKSILTAHVVHPLGMRPEDVLSPLPEVLAKRFRILHTTLHVEAKPCMESDQGWQGDALAGSSSDLVFEQQTEGRP